MLNLHIVIKDDTGRIIKDVEGFAYHVSDAQARVQTLFDSLPDSDIRYWSSLTVEVTRKVY